MERENESKEFDDEMEEEIVEMGEILAEKGYDAADTEKMLPLLQKNREFWLDIMLREELGLAPIENGNNPFSNSVATFLSFVGAGFIPLIPYFFAAEVDSVFRLAVMYTAITLFVVGALRSRFTWRHWLLSGGEMLFVGGIAAFIAYGVGYLVSNIIA